ncbi:M1 family metallopeptidase [Clostridium thermarum]|uniref:M1 family metallopeptidase n=1 Tax=Clostridium thermarum TaxID=1716543 RepID=UPI0013D413C8|nr:M1 family metallopeptidase [Clostridium thermarum]
MRNKKVIIGLIMALTLSVPVGGYLVYNSVTVSRQTTIQQEVNSKGGGKNKAEDTAKEEITHPREWEDGEELRLTENRNAYKLQIALDEKGKKILGHQKIKFRNNYNTSLKDIVFHLYPDSYNTAETRPSIGGTPPKLAEIEIGDIKIDRVNYNGEAMSYSEDNQILKIKLNKELKPGEVGEVTIDFTLKIPYSQDRLGYCRNQYSITNWYPILSIYDETEGSWDENPFHPVGESNYSDCSDYMVEIAVPKDVVVITTGVQIAKKNEGDLNKYIFEADNTRDFVLFMSSEYKVVSKEVDGVKVNSYYLYEESTAKRMLDLACKSLQYFNDTFGKYPYPEYDVVESYLSGGAMEYPTVTQMGPYGKMSENYNANELTFYDEAVVHETAHQWFYSTIGNNEFEDPILDESFTSYATALFFEDLFGKDNPLGVKGSFLDNSYRYTSPIYRSTDKYTWNEFSVIVYKIGPVVLEDLRRQVGEEKFMEIFRTYYQTYKFKNATLEGFLKIIEEKSSKDISNYIRTAFTSDTYSTDALRLRN